MSGSLRTFTAQLYGKQRSIKLHLLLLSSDAISSDAILHSVFRSFQRTMDSTDSNEAIRRDQAKAFQASLKVLDPRVVDHLKDISHWTRKSVRDTKFSHRRRTARGWFAPQDLWILGTTGPIEDPIDGEFEESKEPERILERPFVLKDDSHPDTNKKAPVSYAKLQEKIDEFWEKTQDLEPEDSPVEVSS